MFETCSESHTADDLKVSLNRVFPFLKTVSNKELVQNEAEQNFKKIVENFSTSISKFIKSSENEDIANLEAMVKAEIDNGAIFDKSSLKYAVEDVIGNKLHADIKTTTNTEFKISLIDDFKKLSRNIENILVEQIQEANKPATPSMPTDLRSRQVDEWFQAKQFAKVEDFYKKELEAKFSVEQLTDYIFFLLKKKNYDDSEKAVLQLLQADENFAPGFYLLAFLKTRSGELEAAVLALKIAASLQDRVEFSVLLIMLCEKLGDIEAMQNYETKLGIKSSELEDVEDSESLQQQSLNETELECRADKMIEIYDQVLATLEFQIIFGLDDFVNLTEEFIATRFFSSRKPFIEEKLKIMKMAALGDVDGALEAFESVIQDDENEISFKTLKGDLMFEKGNTWNAVKEYEVVFNLCLKAEQEVPQRVALRCAEWFVSAEDFPKAQRYFHHCCKNYPTFKSWMVLGLVCYRNGRFIEAEYFAEANKIDHKSGDNWLCLALVNDKLQRPSKFRTCDKIASKFDLENTDLVEAEKIFFTR